jgi:hypothetical protein
MTATQVRRSTVMVMLRETSVALPLNFILPRSGTHSSPMVCIASSTRDASPVVARQGSLAEWVVHVLTTSDATQIVRPEGHLEGQVRFQN